MDNADQHAFMAVILAILIARNNGELRITQAEVDAIALTGSICTTIDPVTKDIVMSLDRLELPQGATLQ